MAGFEGLVKQLCPSIRFRVTLISPALIKPTLIFHDFTAEKVIGEKSNARSALIKSFSALKTTCVGFSLPFNNTNNGAPGGEEVGGLSINKH